MFITQCQTSVASISSQSHFQPIRPNPSAMSYFPSTPSDCWTGSTGHRAVQIHYFKVFSTYSDLVDLRSQDLYTILIEEHQSNWLISILIIQCCPFSAFSKFKFNCQRVNNAINNKQYKPTIKQQSKTGRYMSMQI